MHIRYILFYPFLFGACSNTPTPLPLTLSSTRSEACQQELEQSITTLVHAQQLKVSSDVFSQDPYLYLSNKKDSILHDSPIFNDILGKKTVLLYKEKHKLYIGLVGKEKKIQKSVEIKSCKE